jgi:hypothetical protein
MACLAGALSAGIAGAAGTAACLDAAQRPYRDAQRAWHRQIHETTASLRPELAPLSALATELQLAMIDRAELRLRDHWSRSPDAATRDVGLSRLLNPPGWSDADEQALLASDPDYAVLERRIAELRSRSDGDPDWPALRAFVRETGFGTPAVQEAHARLAEAGSAFESAARECAGGE